MKKRLLAMIMTLAMCLSLLPTAAFAGVSAPNGIPVEIDKTAERTGADTWNVTMTVKTDNIAIKPEPMDLVILMDTSYSMKADLEGDYPTIGFGQNITKNPKHDEDKVRIEIAGPAAHELIRQLAAAGINARVAVATFDKTGHKQLENLIPLTSENVGTINNAIPSTKDADHDTATNMSAGLETAAAYLQNSSATNKVIVMLGDGEPRDDKDGNGPSDTRLEGLKANGIVVHTIGFAVDSAVLQNIATKTGGNYYTTSTSTGLSDIFTQIKSVLVAMISDSMVNGDVSIDTTKSPTVSQGTASVTSDGNFMSWNPDNGVLGSNETVTIKYPVKLDDVKVGSWPVKLNGDAVLSYQTEDNETTGELKFPVPTGSYKAASLEVVYQVDGGSELPLPTGYPAYNNGSEKIIITDFGDPDFAYNASYEYAKLPGSASQQYNLTSSVLYIGNEQVDLGGKTIAQYIKDNTANATVAYKVVNTYTLGEISANYRVEHYQQNLNDDGYRIVTGDTETKAGAIGALTDAKANEYPGFTAQSFDQEEISADGETVVKIYYNRNSYNVTYMYDGTAPAGATAVPGISSHKYGAKVTVAPDPAAVSGYTFTGWTSNAPQVDANDTRFIMPAASVTLVGSFSPRTDIQYTVKYLEEETNNVLLAEKVVTSCTFNEQKTESAVDINNYVVVGERTKEFTLDQDNKVITFYYTADFWKDAEETTDVEDEDSTSGGDKIPDKYQVLVNYRSEDSNKGTVAPALEVLTIRDANSTLASTGNVTAEGSTATAGEAYVFTKWEMTAMPVGYTKVADITKNTTGEIALNNVSGKNEFTFTASFAKKSTTVDVEKVVSKITAPDGTAYESLTSAKVGDTITWTITAENKGNVMQTLTLADELSNAANMTAKDSAGNAVTTITLSPGEKETYTVTYTVAPSDAGDTLINTAILKDGGTKKDEDTSGGVKVENPLEVSKTVDKTSAKVNETITYTITVKNTGNKDLSDVVITDTFNGNGTLSFTNTDNVTFADGKFTIKTLAVGKPETITVKYVAVSDDANKTVTNAVVSDLDKTTGNDSVSTEITRPSGGGGSYTPNIPDNPPALNKVDHFAYIVGYPDGNVKPNGNITRAEVATIFFRMLTDESRDEFWSQSSDYSDVTATKWFNNAVCTLSNGGIITGYADGTFKPNGNITRAEFATMAVRFFSASYEGESLFPDIDQHWAKDYINTAAYEGLINGYEDGTFRPNQPITRAEAMAIVNRVLDRHPDKANLLEDMIQWPDNMDTEKWYYADVQEATNSHDYDMEGTEAEPYEVWTEILPVRDWVAFEKEWSDSNSAEGGEVMK